MHVLVTGGTGFVGSHATAALLTAGHEVRLLARNPQRVGAVLGPRGIEPTEVVAGDMTDVTSVRAALAGCDAVIHAAAGVGVADGSAAATAGNVEGVRNVVGEAVALGCDPVIYTSSVAVLYPTRAALLTPASPLGAGVSAYGQSKVDAEAYVRTLQSTGAPVVSLMIGGVYGPGQPEPDSAMISIAAAASQAMVVTRGGVGVLDVRDLAAMIAAACAPGRGPRTYLAGGQFLGWASWTAELEAVIGRRVRRVRVPGVGMTAVGRALDAAKRVRSFDYPLTYEAALYMTSGVPTDDSQTQADLGIGYRPTRVTFVDSVRWLMSTGHLDPLDAPALAP